MRTRVFIFNNASRAANYGIGTYVRQLSDGLAALPDFWISFVEMYADSKEFSIVEDGKGQLHYRIPALASGIETEAYCRSIFYFIARHIEFEESDRLVFQFNYFQHYPLASLLKGQYPHSRIIVTVHYLNWCFELKGNITRMRKVTANGHEAVNDTERRIVSSFMDEKAFLHLADEVIVLSKATEDILARDYKVSQDKTHLIYNGMGDAIFSRACDYTDNVKRNILFVGRLDEIKGLKYLISAFEKIADRYPNAHLVIAGDGDFQPYLEQSRKMMGRVSFLGRVQSKDLEDVYRSAYIGVIPSFHEQCSYTAIEMMRHGIPIVGTDSTGLAEMLDATPQLRVQINYQNFNENEFESQLTSRMDLLLSDKDEYLVASEAVSRQYGERYKAGAMVDGFLQLIQLSFGREDYAVSRDYLKHMDSRMIQLIDQQPDIDLDFFGLSGIGVYLWWRVNSLAIASDEEYQRAFLEEYLIYYLDWIGIAANDSELPQEMLATLCDMKTKGFYKTKAESLLSNAHVSVSSTTFEMPPSVNIVRNALKIGNCKV